MGKLDIKKENKRLAQRPGAKIDQTGKIPWQEPDTPKKAVYFQ
jgi:hypothetical protein